jgi:hypothetical protein
MLFEHDRNAFTRAIIERAQQLNQTQQREHVIQKAGENDMHILSIQNTRSNMGGGSDDGDYFCELFGFIV